MKLELGQRKLSIEPLTITDYTHYCDFCDDWQIASFVLTYENYTPDSGQLDARWELFEIKLCYGCKEYLAKIIYKVG